VLVPHGAVVRLVHEPNYVRLDSLSRLLQLAPLSFDAATFEIWGALLNGGTLVLMPPGPVSPEDIGEVLTRHQVNTVWLTAGLFNQMVDNALPALSGVRQLLAGGDVLSVDHVQKVRGAYPQCQIINGYGPTENTTFSCCHRVPAEEDLSNGVPIGRPITNSICYVLDAGLEPAPIGVTGELYVAGAGLARGYLNRLALTSERVIADPYAHIPGSRMYRTGDVVRWRTDGSLEFVGRADQQVKIRGFRIELGEIEAALRSLEEVADAAVVVKDEERHGKQIIAYIVGRGRSSVDPLALRRKLNERLPFVHTIHKVRI
jgi:amino acid adenylation domain-containing protein